MPRLVFLHVGSPKTGTTYLQAILWRNRELLGEDGVLLPGTSIRDHFLATLDVRDNAARAAEPAKVAGAWDRLVEEASGWADNVLVSHEMLASATAEQARSGIRRFQELGAEVHIVLTVRDLARQLPAEWQERIKHRSQLDFPSFMEQASDPSSTVFQRLWAAQDYVGIVERWGSSLPPGQVHVVTVPASGAPKGLLWERFSGVLGLDPSRYDLEVPRENTSIGHEQAVLLRRINGQLGERLPLPGRYTRVVKELLAHQVLEGRSGTKIVLGGDDLILARKRSQEMVDGLRGHGVDVVGTLDDLIVPNGSPIERSTARGELPVEELLEESVAATIGLLDRVGDLFQQWDEERQEMRQLRQRIREVRERNQDLHARVAELDARRLRARAGLVKRRLLGVLGKADREG